MKKLLSFILLATITVSASFADLLPMPSEQKASDVKTPLVKPTQDLGHVCRADVEKFCKGVTPRQGNIIRCLKQHHEHLSLSCKAHADEVKELVQKRKARRKNLSKACEADRTKFCKGVTGPLKIEKCLLTHERETDFNSACRDALDQE